MGLLRVSTCVKGANNVKKVGLARTIHTWCIRGFWQENHKKYGHARYKL